MTATLHLFETSLRAIIAEAVAEGLARYDAANPAPVGTPVADTAAPKARKKSDRVDMAEKAAALAEPAPAAIAAVALPEPATAPAQVKPSDVAEDRAKLVKLSAAFEGGRAKALELIRRDDATAKFDNLPAARRAEILADLEKLAGGSV